MNNLKPQYLYKEFSEFYNKEHINNLQKINEEDRISSVEATIISLLVDILNESQKYVFPHNFYQYNENQNIDKVKKNYDFFHQLSKYQFEEDNLSIEICENSLSYQGSISSIKSIINILDRNHPLFKKLIDMLLFKLRDLEAKAMFLYRKEKNEDSKWSIPVQIIIFYSDGTTETIDLFKSKAFKMINSARSLEQQQALNVYQQYLQNIYLNTLFLIGKNDMEYLYYKGDSEILYKIPFYFTLNLNYSSLESQSLDNQFKREIEEDTEDPYKKQSKLFNDKMKSISKFLFFK